MSDRRLEQQAPRQTPSPDAGCVQQPHTISLQHPHRQASKDIVQQVVFARQPAWIMSQFVSICVGTQNTIHVCMLLHVSSVPKAAQDDAEQISCRVHVVNNTGSPDSNTWGHVRSSLKVLAAADIKDVSVIVQVQHPDVAALEVSLTLLSDGVWRGVGRGGGAGGQACQCFAPVLIVLACQARNQTLLPDARQLGHWPSVVRGEKGPSLQVAEDSARPPPGSPGTEETT